MGEVVVDIITGGEVMVLIVIVVFFVVFFVVFVVVFVVVLVVVVWLRLRLVRCCCGSLVEVEVEVGSSSARSG